MDGRSSTLSERCTWPGTLLTFKLFVVVYSILLMTTLGNRWFFSCPYFYILRMGKLSS